MSPWAILIALLALAVVLGWVRLLLWRASGPPMARSQPWRLALLLALQPVCAGLLYLTLEPPPLGAGQAALVVATRHAPPAATLVAGDRLIGLPEAPALAGAERAPDLATALRRHPGAGRLKIVGDGLEARDRDATDGRSLTFQPSPPPLGIARLDPPGSVAPGAAFKVAGRIEGTRGGSVELLDPAGRRVDGAPLSATGEFALGGSARAAGVALFRLRVRSAARAVVEEADVPVVIAGEAAPRVLLLAGAPGPEIKYLRRWAVDAGLALHTQLGVGRGLELGDAPLPLNADTLGRLDVVVLDERSSATLSGAQQAALAEAVRGGLGVLLRVTGPVPDAVRLQWRALGLGISSGEATEVVRLPAPASAEPSAVGSPDPAKEPFPDLTRQAVKVEAGDAVPLLPDAPGGAVGSWRAEGRGRVGVWTLTDSFGLVTTGHGDLYGELWSGALATVARAGRASAPQIDPLAWDQQRVTICGISSGAQVVGPVGPPAALLVDPAAGPSNCAGYWPSREGWHGLRQADGGEGVREQPFYVQPADAMPGVRAAETREATLRLSGLSAKGLGASGSEGSPGPSWPWFIALLCALAALWALERARLGRPAAG